MKISIISIEPISSKVNGPGNRAVVWVSGCSIAKKSPCPGCFNSQLWKKSNKYTSTKQLASKINKIKDIDGVTFSGGEPLDQVDAIVDVISKLRKELNTMVFTGYSIDEVFKDYNKFKIWNVVDILKTGRYDEKFKINNKNWISSSNQQLYHCSDRKIDVAPSQARIQLTVKKDGKIHMTGFPSNKFINKLKRNI